MRVSWGRNRAHNLTIDIGTMLDETDGLATAIPPTALVILTAGVNIPSAIVSLAA